VVYLDCANRQFLVMIGVNYCIKAWPC